MPIPADYRGRFAPSPTGPLHFGSLVAGLGSYLDAKHHQGKWLVRMEDLDAPRTVKGAADNILRTLEAFGLYWDDKVLYQSRRSDAYEVAMKSLQNINAVYPCACTRKEIADSALHGIEGQIYPGTCRNGTPAGREGRAWRVRTDTPFPTLSLKGRRELDPLSHRGRVREGAGFEFNDILQGLVTQNLENEIGDFVVKRADGLFAYQLAVVVDDDFQDITRVVRGADLLASTPRQIYLQRLLGLNTPTYMHLPVAVNKQGEKLSKQTLAAPVDVNAISSTLLHALNFLRQQHPAELISYQPEEILAWAIAHWEFDRLKGIETIAE